MVYLTISFRIISIMSILLFLVLKTGRRKIGELPVFDFLTLIILGSIVGADIADPDIDHLPTAYAVVFLIGVQYLLSYLVIKNRKIGSMVTFGPTVIIQRGKFVKPNMKRLKYSVENVLMYLREKDIFDLNEVEYAIVEDSGNISVLKKTQFSPLTPNDMKIETKYKGLSHPLVIEGKIQGDNLAKLGLQENWLLNQLKNQNIALKEVYFAEINTEGNLYISEEEN